ncbi:MAG: MdtA/MuxA family multidrug efflux RND transporter periplasmic adaptor subunit [Candidatus Binatia bacterium]
MTSQPNEPSRQRDWIIASRKRWRVILLAVVCGLVGVYLFRTQSSSTQLSVAARRSGSNTQAVPVVTVKVKTGDMEVNLSGLGTVTALNTVTLKSRVDGQLIKVLFQEGQMVSTGQLLAEIDPRPFQVQLAQAEGQLVRDQALLTNAQIDLERYRTLFKEDSIPKQQLDTQDSLVRQFEGTIKADQSQVDNAKLQLIYSRITAPITGRVGLRLVDVGNMVHAADTTGLLVITQVQPITLVFTLPEDNLPAVLARMKGKQQLTVAAFDREQKQLLASGTLQSIDNQIDPTTGTVKLKAVFANTDGALFPNQFVNARILIDTLHNVTLVPNAAIQRSPQSTFVYTVNSDNTVATKNVEIKLIQGDQTAIARGLDPGETVVIDGVDKLQPGTKVVARAADQAQPRS